MPAGFFSTSTISPKSEISLIPRCGACGLFKRCQSPKMQVTGKGKKKILVVAEAPGKTEDEEGVQLIGKSGQLVRKSFEKLGFDLDRDCWKTNSIICYPGGDTPTDDQVDYCRPNVWKVINELNPEKIILFGGKAVDSVIRPIYRPGENPGAVSQWVGWKIPSQKPNAWICPTYHPAYLLRQNDAVLQLWFDRHLEEAFALEGRPWDEVPDYPSQVEIVIEHSKAAKIIRKMIEKGGRATFDYETNRLKPDAQNAEIVSCSICWEGKKTIAFPWHGEVVKAMDEFLSSPAIEKWGWNIKFEERWTKRILGHRVRKWGFDGMQASHVLDNRSGITSAKFQCFVMLGQIQYDSSVGSYLESVSSSGVNRVKEVALNDLLLYNGMDSLVEFKIAEKQRRLLGWQAEKTT